MEKHIENVKLFGVPVVVAINSFHTDTKAECELIQSLAKQAGAFDAIICNHWSQGGVCVWDKEIRVVMPLVNCS